MTFRATEGEGTAGKGWLPSLQRRGSDREYADRLTGRARVGSLSSFPLASTDTRGRAPNDKQRRGKDEQRYHRRRCVERPSRRPSSRRFANDKCGRKAFVKWFAQTPVQRVIFEPTGPYHCAFGAAGVPFVKVNPRQARRFAAAIGKLRKTDRLGAAILARMGAMLELKTRPPQSEALLELKELLTNLAQEGWGPCHTWCIKAD